MVLFNNEKVEHNHFLCCHIRKIEVNPWNDVEIWVPCIYYLL